MTTTRLFAASLAAALLGATLASAPAEAQQRRGPLVLRVEPRSFLDAGPQVPVGYYGRHLAVANARGFGLPNGVADVSSRGGFQNLPDAIGSGANPFANSFLRPLAALIRSAPI